MYPTSLPAWAEGLGDGGGVGSLGVVVDIVHPLDEVVMVVKGLVFHVQVRVVVKIFQVLEIEGVWWYYRLVARDYPFRDQRDFRYSPGGKEGLEGYQGKRGLQKEKGEMRSRGSVMGSVLGNMPLNGVEMNGVMRWRGVDWYGFRRDVIGSRTESTASLGTGDGCQGEEKTRYQKHLKRSGH
ncbi:hypothetical protein BDQ17DRAFT_1427152 [Cyathus striatus]|nr:hypothetical protein BDQ17DRAFT_1427152 [Cyathus striatus]